MVDDILEPTLVRLQAEAESKGVETDESFFIELDNYSRHDKIREMDKKELVMVIEGIGHLVLENNKDRVGGGHVRFAVNYLCSEVYKDCSQAAKNILDALRHGTDLTSLIQLDRWP